MIECAIFGGVLLDKYLEMETFPERGQDGLINREFDIAGGCSINMAATFNNLGGNAHIVSCAGNDATGKQIIKYMDEHGFSTKYVKETCGDSGYCLVILEDCGERTFLTKKGVECRFDPELLEADYALIRNVMVTGYYLLSENTKEIADCLELICRNGGRFLFDPGPLVAEIEPEILKRVMSMADVITANEVEAEFLDLKSDPDRILVIKKGKDGGEVICGEERFEYQAKKVDAVDTTGAGDSFAAGLMYGLLSGKDVKDAVSLAVECSAITVSLKGPHGFWKLEMERNI